MMINLHKFFTSCGRKNTNSKHFNKMRHAAQCMQ